MTVITLSFLGFLGLFTLVGVASSRQHTHTTDDYLVASRSVNPWLTALSAVSTNNSGYMFVGLIGFTWRSGVSAIWITIGWIIGDFLSWLYFHRRVRAQSEEVDANSVPTLLGRDAEGREDRVITIIAGLATFLFLSLYAAAQLKAGSTATHTLFGWHESVGAIIGALVVVIYCFSGGIRASIWTDAVQSVVMLAAMAALVGYAAAAVGGPGDLLAALGAISPDLVRVVPENLAFGFGLYFLGFIFGGVATVGQPHILIRFMALDTADSVKKARRIYFVWYTLFSLLAFGVGLHARVLLPELGAGLSGDALVTATERALPMMSMELMPAVLVGVMLAGLFSATMSTADSQVLSCSAAITQDVAPRYGSSYGASKIATVVVTLAALGFALWATQGVFVIVLVAWSALASMFAPILFVRLAGLPLPRALALTMMASGLATVILWGRSAWGGDVFKALPGLVVPSVLYAIAWFAVLRSAAGEPAPETA